MIQTLHQTNFIPGLTIDHPKGSLPFAQNWKTRLWGLWNTEKKNSLDKQDIYWYLQMRNFANLKVKLISDKNINLLEIFIKAYDSKIKDKIISLHKNLLISKNNLTLHIKARWEREGNLIILKEEKATIYIEISVEIQ